MSYKPQLKNPYNRSLQNRLSAFVFSISFSLWLMMGTVFATTTGVDLFESGKNIIDGFRLKVVAVSGVLAMAVISIAVISWFCFNDSQKIRTMKDWALRAVWGFIIINMLPSVFITLTNWLNGSFGG